MDRLEELKNKYQSVLDLVKQRGVSLSHLHVQENKLFMQGSAPSEDIKNAVWNQIKAVDSSYSDLIADISVDSSLPQPVASQKTYTVKAGDSLWKIAAQELGNGSEFRRIIAANPGKLEDEHSVIHPGDVLNLPAE